MGGWEEVEVEVEDMVVGKGRTGIRVVGTVFGWRVEMDGSGGDNLPYLILPYLTQYLGMDWIRLGFAKSGG